MEKFLYVFIHLGLPLLVTLYSVLRKYKSRVGLISTSGFGVALVYFLFLWGQWPLVGSYYLRYLMLVFIMAMLGMGIVRYRLLPKRKSTSIFMKLRIAVVALLAMFIFYMCFKIKLTNTNYPYEAVSLEFPLKGGEYYISSGGASNIVNNHFRNPATAQQYAIDINKLNNYKASSKRILSTENTDHFIFSDTVYCPCNGRILEVKTDVKDNLGSTMDVNADDGTGNYVHIQCNDIYVFIPHFKQYSIRVSVGDQVRTGEPLGLVGNSGFSQEPHLHIQASKKDSNGTNIGVPIKFKGKILSRNNLIRN